MSLDIAILGEDGAPDKQVSINVNDHHRLMHLAGAQGALLSRLKDFYQDAEFETSELDALLREVMALLTRVGDDDRMEVLLKKLLELIGVAKSEKRPLVAIAD